MGCIALVRCVLVLRCGLAVMVWYIRMQAKALVPQPAYGYTTPPQSNHNVTPTHIKPGMCKLRYPTSEYIQETLSKHTTR